VAPCIDLHGSSGKSRHTQWDLSIKGSSCNMGMFQFPP
jgi:hypothetical protein